MWKDGVIYEIWQMKYVSIYWLAFISMCTWKTWDKSTGGSRGTPPPPSWQRKFFWIPSIFQEILIKSYPGPQGIGARLRKSWIRHCLLKRIGRSGNYSIQELLYNSNPRLGLEFDCNSQALLDRGAKPLIDFNAFWNYIQFSVMLVTPGSFLSACINWPNLHIPFDRMCLNYCSTKSPHI